MQENYSRIHLDRWSKPTAKLRSTTKMLMARSKTQAICLTGASTARVLSGRGTLLDLQLKPVYVLPDRSHRDGDVLALAKSSIPTTACIGATIARTS